MMRRLKKDILDNESDSRERETHLPIPKTPTNFENPINFDSLDNTQPSAPGPVQTKSFNEEENLRFAKLFRNFSCHRTSLMNFGNFKRMMNELGSCADEETMEKVFQLADKDEDAHLSLNDFLKIARVAHFQPPLSGLMVLTNKEAVDRLGQQSILGRVKITSYSVFHSFFPKFK